MKKTYTDEEVKKIEDSAFETGVAVGKTLSSSSIKYHIQREIDLNQLDLDNIKKSIETPGLSDEDIEDLINDKNNAFLYIVGLNTALRIIEDRAQ